MWGVDGRIQSGLGEKALQTNHQHFAPATGGPVSSSAAALKKIMITLWRCTHQSFELCWKALRDFPCCQMLGWRQWQWSALTQQKKRCSSAHLLNLPASPVPCPDLACFSQLDRQPLPPAPPTDTWPALGIPGEERR